MANLPISQFLTARLEAFDPTFEIRVGTGFEKLFFQPLQFIVQPLRDEANDIFTGQSLLRILNTDDPDSFDEEVVDAMVANLYVYRRTGGQAGGTARVYYNDPADKEYPAGGASFIDSNGNTYSNVSPFRITSSEMALQLDGDLYYYDIQVLADVAGTAGNIDADQLVELQGDTDVVRVTNQAPFEDGIDAELNTALINRTKNSIAVRDLLIGKGFTGVLFENFINQLAEIQPIGFEDKEMMRDILFNTHVGGRVDGYVKTGTITPTSKNFLGLQVDGTRQSGTDTNVQPAGGVPADLGFPNIDRSNGLAPIVTEIKPSVRATYRSTVTFPINLAAAQYVKIGIDGLAPKNVRVAGVNPAATTRNEVVSLINSAFGVNIAFADGLSFRIDSPTTGLGSQISISDPDVGYGNSAVLLVFNLPISFTYNYFGDGPYTFLEGIDYSIDDSFGTLTRIVGGSIVTEVSTGQSTDASNLFNDPTSGVFAGVQARDILTIVSGPDAGDYRIIGKVTDNQIRLDASLTTTALTVDYMIRRTGIKSGETIFVKFWFNPISIDICKFIPLDLYGRTRGIRPGRDLWTITDLPLLRIVSVQQVDVLTGELIGDPLIGPTGYGRGGYGEGGYGHGGAEDWYMVVNNPGTRFSMFEDSYIVLTDPSLIGSGIKITYDFCPDIEAMHNFVRSENERIIDGEILMKHFLPAYVKGVIQYSVNNNDTSIPDNDTVQKMVRNKVTFTQSGTALEYSDLIQAITRMTDPNDRYTTFVKTFALTAEIHNADGTVTGTSGVDELIIPTLDPFPIQTDAPLSPRIAHWIGGSDIVLERL